MLTLRIWIVSQQKEWKKPHKVSQENCMMHWRKVIISNSNVALIKTVRRLALLMLPKTRVLCVGFTINRSGLPYLTFFSVLVKTRMDGKGLSFLNWIVWCGNRMIMFGAVPCVVRLYFFLSPRWGFVRNLYLVGRGSIAFHPCQNETTQFHGKINGILVRFRCKEARRSSAQNGDGTNRLADTCDVSLHCSEFVFFVGRGSIAFHPCLISFVPPGLGNLVEVMG